MALSRGLRLLQAARLVELKRLMRVKEGETKFTEYLTQMRNVADERPVSAELLQGLHQVSSDDLNRDPEWRFAPIGVMSHIERDVLNLHQLKAFARHFGLPLVKWRLKMVDEVDDRALRDDLYADEPNLWQYFVEGAPINLTCASRHLATASVSPLRLGTVAFLRPSLAPPSLSAQGNDKERAQAGQRLRCHPR